MHRYISIIFALAVLLAFAQLSVYCETAAASNKQAEKQAPPMTEDDRLPFMSEAAAEESPRETPSSTGLIIRAGGALILVIGLLFAGTWALRKLGFGNQAISDRDHPTVSVLTTVSMGNGRSIAAVSFGDRVFLVGTTPQSFTLLAEQSPEISTDRRRSVADMLSDEEEVEFEDFLRDAAENSGNSVRPGGWA